MNKKDVLALPAGSVVAFKGKPRLLASRPEYDYQRPSSHGYAYFFEKPGESKNHNFEFSELSLDVPAADATALKVDYLPSLAAQIYPSNGTDPEIFVTNKAGVVIPAFKFLSDAETAKANGRKYGANVYTYWDGFQAEISTPAGFSCHERMTGAIAIGLRAIRVAAVAHDPGAKLLAVDAAKVDKKDLITASDNHVAFGCAPSHNVYGIEKIEIENPREVPYRFSGTHFHYQLGMHTATKSDWWPNGVVAMIDKIGGLVLTALGRDAEDPMRRKFYGRPGEYRSGSQGHIEYRTPGAFLMRHPAFYIFGADICRFGFKMGCQMDGRVFDAIPDVKNIILNCDADEAVKIIKKNNALFNQIFNQIYGNDLTKATLAVLTAKKGASSKIKSIEEEWGMLSTYGALPANYRWRNTVQTLA